MPSSFYADGESAETSRPMSEAIKMFLRQNLSPQMIDRLRRVRWSSLSWFYRRDLIKLAILFRTDKWGTHWYMKHYQEHFERFRQEPVRLLEIGVGGYAKRDAGGASLRVWKAYFRKGQICGLDIYDKQAILESRIRLFRGDQSDPAVLRDVIRKMGGVDIVIDDGSHINSQMISSFETLFPLLSDHGVYVVEDVCSSYWPGFGGRSDVIGAPGTSMGYFKALTECLNYDEVIRPDYTPSYYDQHIVSVCFYHNIIFIFKGDNREGSYGLKNNVPVQDFVMHGNP